jgi:hypothetical protein
MSEVAAILPARGRHAETLALIPRLLATAGMDFELHVVVDEDPTLSDLLWKYLKQRQGGFRLSAREYRGGYWRVLRAGTQATDAPLLVNLANDLLPGLHWLKRAVEVHQRQYGDGPGVVGFNDGIHTGAHAAHMLISRALLEGWYGGDYWPLHYQHEYGDTEIVQRAQQVHRWHWEATAVLYHNHPYTGQNGGQADRVYQEGWATRDADRALFMQRKARGWA